MAADDVVEAVAPQEGRGDVRAELLAHASLGGRSAGAWHGVRPQQLAHDACRTILTMME